MQKCIIDCNKCTKKVCYFCKNCERWDQYTELLKNEKNPHNCANWLCNNVLDYCAPSILAKHFNFSLLKDTEKPKKDANKLIQMEIVFVLIMFLNLIMLIINFIF